MGMILQKIQYIEHRRWWQYWRPQRIIHPRRWMLTLKWTVTVE